MVHPKLISSPNAYAPGSLSHSFDYLNSVWRLKFGKMQRLFQLRSAASTAGLEEPCKSKDEFQARMSSLSDIIKCFDIPDSLLGGVSIPPDQTINRLRAALAHIVAGGLSMDLTAALSTLTAVNDLRVSFQHASTRVNQVTAFKSLGITFPGTDWSEDWDRVRSLTAGALRLIAEEIDRHT